MSFMVTVDPVHADGFGMRRLCDPKFYNRNICRETSSSQLDIRCSSCCYIVDRWNNCCRDVEFLA